MVSRTENLGNLTDIMVGLVLKRKEADVMHQEKYEYKVLTLKSFNSEGWLNKDELFDFVSCEILDERYITSEGDIVIRLSSPYTAIPITLKNIGYVIPSLFAVIRPDKRKVIPEYISLFLSSDKIKKLYLKTSIGMTIPVIKVGSLRETEIPLIPIEQQKKIGEISKLIVKERKLLSDLAKEKEIYYQALVNELIQEETK